MRRSARNQPLPPEEVAILKSLTGPTLKARCRDLYNVGWTLSAIGTPLNRQRSTIRLWITDAPAQSPAQPVTLPEDKAYVHKKPPSPGLTPSEHELIHELAPLARRYRARLPENHPSTRANKELTELCITLHSLNIPIQELADAAGVTYRAMYRRVKNDQR
jgi:hypothetical protein